ncbi:chymotrypsin inhibitor Ani s 6-like [Anopheles merus]|uniref:TIL domain-containing protein n=1 Tax=Anopheles merus TaxID=30066 RepID=A0A182UP74_ANOME|nr:chymotrypsin inhibitor Ani s 6-like [Anopheles merus]
MKYVRCISLIVFVALMVTFVHSEDCTVENEEYYSCASPCRRNCTNLAQMLSCTGVCVSGCFCRPGYFRREDNACVKPWLCSNNSLQNKLTAGNGLDVPH